MQYVEGSNSEAGFGGSLDLPPIHVDVAQRQWFHAQLNALCQAHNARYCARFKATADGYSCLHHRRILKPS